jgi:hypothetical protein
MSAASALQKFPEITVDWELAFQNPITCGAGQYWVSLCGHRDMPARSDVRPSAMRRYLQYVNLVDVDPQQQDSYVVSLQGMQSVAGATCLLDRSRTAGAIASILCGTARVRLGSQPAWAHKAGYGSIARS